MTGTCPPADPALTSPAAEITDCYSELLPTGSWEASARLKVEAVGNVFFDVSHADLAVDGTR